MRPLILFTNDDGVQSPGLLAAAAAFTDVADVLVVAPNQQQSGMGRSLPINSPGTVHEYLVELNGVTHTTYGVEGTPAQAVQQGVLEIANQVMRRRPTLVISGINYGENTGNGVTISGTVGAALEAASLGIRAMAVSQQTEKNLHLTHSKAVDFSTAAHFTRRFGLWLLENLDIHTQDVDLLKLDLPANATLDTPWSLTNLSRTRVYWPARHEKNGRKAAGPLGYFKGDTSRSEPNSDVYAVFEEKVISLTPISLDMTSRVDFDTLQTALDAAHSAAE